MGLLHYHHAAEGVDCLPGQREGGRWRKWPLLFSERREINAIDSSHHQNRAATASPARGPLADRGELVQAHDDRDIFQASPD
jgi:hypothetical protein